jgi:hypothetical protein
MVALLDTAESEASPVEAFREFVNDLEHGWLSGSAESPRGLARAWRFARAACDRGDGQKVPLGLLLMVSLACDGAAAIEMHHPLLVDAWQQKALDAPLLLDLIAHRVGDARFTSVNSPSTSAPPYPIAQYERGLATLAAWLFARIDEEEDDSPLRAEAVRIFAPALAPWLLHTQIAPAREHLLNIVTLITRWDAEPGAQLIRAWVVSRLEAGGNDARLRLPSLHPTAHDPLLDRDQMRLLLVRAASGGGFQTDVEEWLIRWADHGSVDDRLVRELAADVAGWLGQETRTFEWIARVARVRSSPRLTAELVQLDPVKPFGNLGSYVIARLRSLDPEEEALWIAKRNAFFAVLAVLVQDFSAADRVFLQETVHVGQLTPDGRDGASILAARMLDGTSSEDAAEWLAVLANALASGATGWGRLGGALRLLTTAQSRQLENNLLTTLSRRRDIPNPDVVEWIGCTITDAGDAIFAELEAELCRLLIADERTFALAAANVLMHLCAKRPELIGRNADRIQRAQIVLLSSEHEGRFRPTSAFMSNINALSEAAASLTSSATA